MTDKQVQKQAKKAAKTAAKAAKKGGAGVTSPAPAASTAGHRTPAERSAAAAEKQVKLQRLRVLFAVLSGLIALGSLIAIVARG